MDAERDRIPKQLIEVIDDIIYRRHKSRWSEADARIKGYVNLH
jgi:hypothetical protein